MDRTQTVQALEVLRRCTIWIYVLLTYKTVYRALHSVHANAW